MNTNLCGISVGRFQPYTLAHNFLHKKMLQECLSVAIYVINPDYNNPKYNPFTQREIGKMIRNSFSEEELKKIKIIFISNTEEIKIKKIPIVEYSTENNFYLDDGKVNKINLEIPINFKKEREILDSIYDKKLEFLDQVNPKNIRYLRRIVLPF